MTKWQQIEVGDVEGHVIATFEKKGIDFNLDGKPLYNGWARYQVGYIDFNAKTGLVESCNGHDVVTDPQGDKIHEAWKSYPGKIGTLKGEVTMVKGTGKYEGIKGKGNRAFYPVTDLLSYVVRECEVELP